MLHTIEECSFSDANSLAVDEGSLVFVSAHSHVFNK